MRGTPSPIQVSLVALSLMAGIWSAPLQGDDEKVLAKTILEKSGVHGGLIVHLGCGNGKLTLEFFDQRRFLVHGLSSNETAIQKARKRIRARGSYGQIRSSAMI